MITPVTLKPRFNPHFGPRVTRPESGTDFGKLPAAVDPRQMSLFAAGWTLGSLKYLAESGVQSVTYYETTGWRGVMETEQGSQYPELFPSVPGGVFPVWHVLADVGEFAEAEVIRTISSEPLKVVGLALRRSGNLRLLAANLSGGPQTIVFERGESHVRIRRLNPDNLPLAIAEPERFREQAAAMLTPARSRWDLRLLQDEIVTLDFYER